MEWLLGISVVVNIILALTIAFLVHSVITAQNEAHHNLQEWSRWENRWYELQSLVSDKFKCHVSPSGMKTKIEMTEHAKS
jgi:hypothetical protein